MDSRELTCCQVSPCVYPLKSLFSYYKRLRREAPIGYPTSGGLAFHTDRSRAILHGLYEYIERDAINVRRYCRLAPPRVELDLTSIAHEAWHLRHARSRRPGRHRFDSTATSLDVPIPVFTAGSTTRGRMIRSSAPRAWTSVSARSRRRCSNWGRRAPCSVVCGRPGRDSGRQPYIDMRQFLDGALYFGHVENHPRLEWYVSGGRTIDWNDISGPGPETTAQWLLRAGLTPIVLDWGRCLARRARPSGA